MSASYNGDGLFVDTGLLRDHVSKLYARRNTAKRLYEKVAGMRRADDPEVAYRYDSVLREIDQLIEYFDRMARLLDNVGDDAVALSLKIGNVLEEGTEYTRRTTTETFML